MERCAVPQGVRILRSALLGAILVATLALVLSGPVATASAAKLVGKNGRIYACYKVGGGKAKGRVRLVARRMHCRRGERKVSWSIRGPRGPAGGGGQAGTAGAAGGAALESRISALESRLSELGSRIESLEGLLAGISNTQLQEAIGALADTQALCTQVTAMTSKLNSFGSAFEGLELAGVIPTGLELLIPALPSALPSFDCP